MRSIFQKWPVRSISTAYFPVISRNDPAVLLMLIAYCRVFSRSDPSDRFAQPTAFSRNDPFYLYLLPTAVYFPGNYLSCRLKWPILLTPTEFEMTHLIDSDGVWNVPPYWLEMQTVRFPWNDSLLAFFFPGNVRPYWLSIFQEMTHIIDSVFLFRGNYPLYRQTVFFRKCSTLLSILPETSHFIKKIKIKNL